MSDSSCQTVKDWFNSLPAIMRYHIVDYKILESYKWENLNEIDRALVKQRYDSSEQTVTEDIVTSSQLGFQVEEK